MTPNSHRHTPFSELESYLQERLTGAFAISGNPSARMVVLVQPERAIGLRVAGTGPTPDLTRYENLEFVTFVEDEQPWQQVSSTLSDNADEVYSILCTISDRVQLDNQPFHEAIADTLDAFDSALRLRSALSEEKQIGLAGELITLQALAAQCTSSAALDQWRGPRGGEHDFALPEFDLEVKTTASERRQHQISSVGQLAPTHDRQLYLLSIQLTRSAISSGETLPQLVDRIRTSMPGHERFFHEVLSQIGYREKDADLYRTAWKQRSAPEFYRVDDNFPALTQSSLDLVVPSSQRITDIRYRIDLTGLTPSPPLFDFKTQSASQTHV